MTSSQIYQRSYELTKKYGTSYFYSALLLNKKSRRHIYALYALCRYADDLVDVVDGSPGTSDTAKQDLDRFKIDVYRSIDIGSEDDDLLGAIATTWNQLNLPISYLDRFFNAMEMDLTISTYDTFEELLCYMDGSAAVIGEMVLPVLEDDPSKHEGLLENARSLGNAFQLTNFLRDVGEDWQRGRCYIPQKDLVEYGVDPSNLVFNDQFIELMKFEIERNYELYEKAFPGVIALKGRSGACVRTAYKLYGGILGEIEKNGFDSLNKRARLSTNSKYGTALKELCRLKFFKFEKLP